MAFKMKGWQAHGKSPMKQDGSWISRLGSWGKDKLQKLSDSAVNISNVAGNDPDTQAMHDAYLRKQKRDHQEMIKRHEDADAKEKQLLKYEAMYMSDPISKQRSNESDDQYRRRMADVKKHKRRFAEKKYKERMEADAAEAENKSLAMSPMDEKTALAADQKRPPLMKKKKY